MIQHKGVLSDYIVDFVTCMHCWNMEINFVEKTWFIANNI